MDWTSVLMAFGVLGCDDMGYNKGQGQDIARAEGAWLWQG